MQLRRMPHDEQERRRKVHCQTLHWKAEGGHKKDCKRWAAEAAEAAEAAAVVAAAEAAEREAREEEEKARADPNTRSCSMCGRHLLSDAFSKNQWKKGPWKEGATRACEDCKSN